MQSRSIGMEKVVTFRHYTFHNGDESIRLVYATNFTLQLIEKDGIYE